MTERVIAKAERIAATISDYISAQNARYADRPRVLAGAYKAMVIAIAEALALGEKDQSR